MEMRYKADLWPSQSGRVLRTWEHSFGTVGTRLFNANGLFMLTLELVIGRGTGVVIATGTETEFGVIFSMMQDVSFSYNLVYS